MIQKDSVDLIQSHRQQDDELMEGFKEWEESRIPRPMEMKDYDEYKDNQMQRSWEREHETHEEIVSF